MEKFPEFLNVGSGNRFFIDSLNIDINPLVKSDVLADITKISFDDVYVSERHGEFKFKENMFDKIGAYDVLEHIPNLVSAMKNCYKLLKYDGTMQIIVPYDLSYGAWQDPTHVRAFNERSWTYWTMPWCQVQFGWKEGFTLKEDSIEFNLDEDVTIPSGFTEFNTPRAIKSLRVKLYKFKKV